MPPQAVTEISVDLTAMNHTELVLLARWMGMQAVTRAVPRDVLIHAIQEFETIEYRNPIDSYRRKLSGWLKRHWDRLQMQALKPSCPHCDRCNDMQALDCFLINKAKFGVDDSG